MSPSPPSRLSRSRPVAAPVLAVHPILVAAFLFLSVNP